jgi:hypothetical protein
MTERAYGLVDQVNFVVNAWDVACEEPWTVYVETALPAALDLIIAWASFGFDDVVRGYFRPNTAGRRGLPLGTGLGAPARSARHGRRGARSRGRGRRFPEFGEMIGKRLPGQKAVASRHVTDGVRNLWQIDGMIQRGLYHWMVVDTLTQFAYDWTSALYSTRACQNALDGRLIVHEDYGITLPHASPNPFNLTNIITQQNGVDWDGRTASFDAKNWFFTVATTLRLLDDLSTNITIYWRDAGYAGTVLSEKTVSLSGEGDSQDVVLHCQPTGLNTVSLWWDCTYGNVAYEETRLIGRAPVQPPGRPAYVHEEMADGLIDAYGNWIG